MKTNSSWRYQETGQFEYPQVPEVKEAGLEMAGNPYVNQERRVQGSEKIHGG